MSVNESKHLKIENHIAYGSFKCVFQVGESEGCDGILKGDGDSFLKCPKCSSKYQVLNGVPEIKQTQTEADDQWFEEMYDNRSREDDIDSGYLQEYTKPISDLVEENSLVGPCLEIGCGTGIFADTVNNYVGLEYAYNSLFVPGFEGYSKVCADASFLPLESGFAELIFSFNTLEHVPRVDLAFAELDRVLKRGGFLFLKPAWHCTKYNTELIPVLPYSELSFRQRLVKLSLPILRSKVWKLCSRVPKRIVRRLSSDGSLKWRELTPYHGELWIADADAVADIDCHEAISYFLKKGYECLSHPKVTQQLLAGHDVVILKKL